jgi:NAD(P)H-hydrate epimerase
MSPSDPSATPLPRLPPRAPTSHKGDFGRALLIGGSQGMAGAIALAGMAALRSGAGLVKIATPSACQATVAAFEPSLMTVALPGDTHGRIASWAVPVLAEIAGEATAVACGPGLGQSDELVEVVGWLYQSLPHPMVVDADALNALARRPDVLSKPAGPRILTPHPGEFARLTGHQEIPPDAREDLARELALRTGAVVVLKGHRTAVTDGTQTSINPTGNPGMATGGTGDVLTGIITALVCQHLSLYDAARLGVYVHGLAGDLAAADLGQISLIASDLVKYLPKAWQQVSR